MRGRESLSTPLPVPGHFRSVGWVNRVKGFEMATTTARDIMTPAPKCVGENETLVDAANLMASLDVGALPICGEDDRLKGMLTDRDIVVKAIAQGKDLSSTRAGELGQGDSKTVTIGADDSIEEALRTMSKAQVRRLPVIDGHDLVGIIAQADIARNYDEEKVGDLVEAISR
jgi:CBS domain-containing protein